MCGGFIIVLRFNHAMFDNGGVVQFMLAVAEMVLGARAPSILPVWQRELLNARDPPRVTFSHREYDEVLDPKATLGPPESEMVHRSFFFGPSQIAALRNHMPHHLRTSCTTFELLTACLWRCRTLAIGPDPAEEVRVLCVVNARAKYNPPLPTGYYGNVIAFPAAISTARKLSQNPLEYAVELVKRAKSEVSQEYMQSVADLMVLKGRPPFTVVRTWIVSNLKHGGSEDVDFGWGKPIYSGPPKTFVGKNTGVLTWYVPFRNRSGEDGIVVPIFLPEPAMDRFSIELESFINEEKVGKGLEDALLA